MARIHPTAVIDPRDKLAQDVEAVGLADAGAAGRMLQSAVPGG
jgi:acyl-[acyl carrier protein]--UDP-N-acetylglucosamine O-acyltransferase